MSENNKSFGDKAKDLINDVKDDSSNFDKKSMEDGKGMAILCYILPFIPYFVEKKNKFVKYHAAQGMNLLVIGISYGIIYSILTSIIKVNGSCGSWLGYNIGNYCKVTPLWVTLPLSLIGLCIFIIAVIGIINVCNNKAKELPIVNKLKIFK
jgi:uncharacterized membrane protein